MSKRQKIREQVYNKYNGHCAYCGKEITMKQMQIDHIIPLQRGCVYNPENLGTDEIDNMNPSCRACNFKKGILTIEDFRQAILQQCKNIIKRSFQVRQSIDYGLLIPNLHEVKFYFETH